MPTYIGENKIVDRYLGDRFLEAAYIGDTKVYDPYTEITGTLPMIFHSRVAGALKNYRIYGTAGGSGTAAGSGEPAGYKIPLTVTSGEQSMGYDLFIGNSKLGEDEYLEFRSKWTDKMLYDKAVISDAAERRVRLYVKVIANFPASVECSTTGIIIYRGTECPVMTRESAAAHDDIYDYNTDGSIYDTVARVLEASYVFYRGYAILSDGTLIYGDTVGVTLNEQVTEVIEAMRIVSSDIPRYQIIYKRSENDFPYAEPGVFGFSEGTATVTSDGAGRFILWGKIPHGAESEKIPLKSDYTVPVPVGSGGTYTFYIGNDHRDYLRIVFYDAAGNELTAWQANTVWRKTNSYQFTGTIHSVAFRNTKSDATSVTVTGYAYSPMFSENGSLDSYVPYLQPTDPPAPLPAVNTCKGENTLSSTETVGSVTVRGRIRPLNYRRVEYLRSTKTQIIVTDIIPTASNRYELDLQFTASERTEGNRQFFGARKTQNGALYTIYACNWSGGGLEDQRIFTYTFNVTTNAYTNISSTIKLNRNTLSLVGGSGTYGNETLSPVSISSPTDINLPIALFGITNGETASDTIIYTDSEMTLYGFKVYDGTSNLLHNLLPVERDDGELGLLDEITGKFYTNAGTGTFEKGGYV